MKLFSKVSALGAALILSTAFASADSLQLGSYCTGSTGCTGAGTDNNTATTYLGFTAPGAGFPGTLNPPAPNPTPTVGTATFFADPGTVWTAAGSGSTYVSYSAGTGPGNLTTIAADGYYDYVTDFTLTNAAGDTGSIWVLADDTTDIYLNGVQITPEGGVGGDSKCADAEPNCQVPDLISLTGLINGTNQLEFFVAQTGSNATGLDFYGSVAPVPEPSTLLMFGTGLIGAAGVLRRRLTR
jgi:hypothetical protein